MPFKSETAKQVGSISRRGKSLATEIRNQITEVAEELIKAIDIGFFK
jgi:phage host-nuclease inhibitor protein Gam